MMNLKNMFWIVLAGIFASGDDVFANPSISKIKEGRALVMGVQGGLEVGDYLVTVREDGRFSGLVQVQAVKNARAIVVLAGGEVEEGQTVVSSAQKRWPSSEGAGHSEDMASGVSSSSSGGFFPPQPTRRSFLGASIFKMDQSMKVRFSSGSVNMTGEAWKFAGFWEPAWEGPVRLRAVASLTTVTLSGRASSSSCATTRNCEFSSLNLGGGLDFVYGFWENRSFRAWGSAGLRGDMPVTKSTNAVKEEGLTIATSLLWGAGLEWRLDGGQIMPFGLVQSMNLQQAEGVESSSAGIFAGYATTF